MEAARTPAPGDLELIQELVNTADLERGTDALATPESCRAWLGAHDLLDRDDRLSAGDVEMMRDVREGVRALLVANNGSAVNAAALERMNWVADRVSLHVTFRSQGAQLEAPRPGVNRAIGRLFAIMYDAMVGGTWPRLKVCRSSDCQWAFYDHSKNRSGAWCSMSSCGNKTKTRAYRQRKTAVRAVD